MSVRTRRFSHSDQVWFARVSGDANPLHLDPKWAATVFPGAVVVHGLHVLLWALDCHAGDNPNLRLEAIEASFLKPVLLGDVVRVEANADAASFRCLVQDEPVVVVKLPHKTGADLQAAHGAVPSSPLASPREPPPERLKDAAGEVILPEAARELTEAFPKAAAATGARPLRGLAAISTLVGMECPGLHGVLSTLAVSFNGADPVEALNFRVRRYNAQFSQVEMRISGIGLSGTVGAFMTRAAPPPPSREQLRSLVKANEFAGQKPLIIGASNGLGEITSRLLAAGGADPTLTWHQSREAAEQVQAWTSELGARSSLVHFDATAPAEGLAALHTAGWNGEQLYYFATPRIFRRRIASHQDGDLRDFYAVYADGFGAIVRALMTRSRRLTVFYPSSVAVDENDPNLVEYRTAKMAGEELCAQLQREYKSLSIVIARLPRIETRQTRTFIKVKAVAPELAMMPHIRAVQGTASIS